MRAWLFAIFLASCLAAASDGYATAAVNGVCGYANGSMLSDPPSNDAHPDLPAGYSSRNLCKSGVPSEIARSAEWSPQSWTWTWSCAGSDGGTTAQCLAVHSPRNAQYVLDFTDDSAVRAFLEGKHAKGVSYVVPIDTTAMGPAIKAKGYKVQEGLGAYAAEWVQDSLNGKPKAGMSKSIYDIIDKLVRNGVTMIWINEINPKPGEKSWFTHESIAYTVKGVNMLYNYIHQKYPGVEFGLSTGSGQGVDLHLALLRAGMKEDFAQVESYNVALQPPSPFVMSGLVQEFPRVKLAALIYNTISLCGNGGMNWIDPKGLDYIGFWNVNLDGKFIGPQMDADFQKNAEIFAATGQKSFCALPYSRILSPATKEAQTQSFVAKISDYYYAKAYTDPKSFTTITGCEYKVMSGANAIMGPTDPSVKVTQPWTPRNCSGDITITVGPEGMCRDKGKLTCLVFTRARMPTGQMGNTSYQEYSISY